jgi:hypothetical protein
VLLGLLIFFAGIALAFSDPIPAAFSPIYPNAIDGAIVVLIGLVTIIIGFAIPESETIKKT